MKHIARYSGGEIKLQRKEKINTLIDSGTDRVCCKSGEIATLCFLLTQTILSWKGESKKDDYLFQIDGYQVENVISTLEMIKSCADDVLEEGISQILGAQDVLNSDIEVSTRSFEGIKPEK
jgi:hypothetical protein